MKPNTPKQSFFHPLDDVYVGSDAPKENLGVSPDWVRSTALETKAGRYGGTGK